MTRAPVRVDLADGGVAYISTFSYKGVTRRIDDARAKGHERVNLGTRVLAVANIAAVRPPAEHAEAWR